MARTVFKCYRGVVFTRAPSSMMDEFAQTPQISSPMIHHQPIVIVLQSSGGNQRGQMTEIILTNTLQQFQCHTRWVGCMIGVSNAVFREWSPNKGEHTTNVYYAMEGFLEETPWEIIVVGVSEALDGTSLQGFCWPSTFVWSSLGINIYKRVYLPCCQICNLNMTLSHLSNLSFIPWHVIWKATLSFRFRHFKRIKRF